MTKTKLKAPEARVPSDWTKATVSDFANVSAGGTPSRAVGRFWKGKIPWVTTKEVDQCTIFSTKEKITKVGLENSAAKLVPSGSILMALYGQGKTRGKVAVLGLDAATNQACAAIQIVSKVADPEFVFWNLVSRYEEIRELSNSGSQENLSGEIVRKIELTLPPIEEQRAIAGVLSDVDALIESLDALITKKRDLKQATMQQLLTGQIRLPGFYAKWKSGLLDSLVSCDDEALTSSTKPDFLFNYISLESVTRGVLGPTERITFADAPSRARRIIRANDVLFGTVRPNLQSHLLVGDVTFPTIASTGFAVLRYRQGVCDPRFVFQWLFSGNATRQIEAMLVGSNYPALNSKDVRSLKIESPCLEEQAAIAQVLNDMDAEIDALIARRDKNKLLKTGLMQELLSGRRRLV